MRDLATKLEGRRGAIFQPSGRKLRTRNRDIQWQRARRCSRTGENLCGCSTRHTARALATRYRPWRRTFEIEQGSSCRASCADGPSDNNPAIWFGAECPIAPAREAVVSIPMDASAEICPLKGGDNASAPYYGVPKIVRSDARALNPRNMAQRDPRPSRKASKICDPCVSMISVPPPRCWVLIDCGRRCGQSPPGAALRITGGGLLRQSGGSPIDSSRTELKEYRKSAIAFMSALHATACGELDPSARVLAEASRKTPIHGAGARIRIGSSISQISGCRFPARRWID